MDRLKLDKERAAIIAEKLIREFYEKDVGCAVATYAMALAIAFTLDLHPDMRKEFLELFNDLTRGKNNL